MAEYYVIIITNKIYDLFRNIEDKDKRDEYKDYLAEILGYKDYANYVSSTRRNRKSKSGQKSYPRNLKKDNTHEYYIAIKYLIENFCSLPEFAESLFKTLMLQKVFPKEYLGYEEQIIQELKENKESQFETFISDLISKDLGLDFINPKQTIGKPEFETLPQVGTYFSQRLFDSKNNTIVFDIKKADFSLLKKDRFILIEGEGGQGKTTFLQKLNKTKQTDYKHLITISLAQFVEYVSKTASILFNKSMFFEYILSLKCVSSNDINSIFKKDGETAVLLIDGFNEAYVFGNINDRDKVIDTLEFIKKQYPNISFIVTSRPSEGGFSFRTCDFLKDFNVYYLSGVDEQAYNEFCEKHRDLPNTIIELAKIPLYFNALSKSENIEKIKTKSDLLREIYYQNYKQASLKPGSENLYAAYYLLAPTIANYMTEHRSHYIDKNEIYNISEFLFSKNNLAVALLHNVAAREQQTSDILSNDAKSICNVLINNGPLNSVEQNGTTTFVFFHDEIRKYLTALNSWMEISATKLALFKEDFSYMSSLNPNFNLESESIELFKEKAGIANCNAEDVVSKIASFFDVENLKYEKLPQQVIFYHNVFRLSEYLGVHIVNVDMKLHEVLEPFVETLTDIIKDDTLSQYFDGISDSQRDRCYLYIVEIFCKDCEYLRKLYENNKDITSYEKAKQLLDLAKTLNVNDNGFTEHHYAKLLLRHYEFNSDLNNEYRFGMEKLENVTIKGFNLSANLFSMIKSVPALFLIERNQIDQFDYIDAFWAAYNSIIINERHGNQLQEIKYTVRQAVSLLLKGNVALIDTFDYSPGKVITKSKLTAGNKSTFNLSKSTLCLAKYLISKVDGLSCNSLDYYRAIIKIYEGNDDEARLLLNNEKDFILSKIVLNYKFSEKNNIEDALNGILKRIKTFDLSQEPKLDKCHPIYWGLIDPMNLELSLNPSKKAFYKKIVGGLDPICKKAVELSQL